jgi:hypothetical protein
MEDHPVSLTPLAEGGSDGGLIGLGDQFAAYYRPDDATFRSAYSTGVVVLDTNVLLDLYRLSPTARNSLMNVIRGASREHFRAIPSSQRVSSRSW